MKMKLHHILLLGLTLLTPTKSAKILGIFPLGSRSHHSFNQPIVKGLAANGHEVTVISHFQSEDAIPNYTEILLPRRNEALQDWVDSIPIEVRDDLVGFSSYLKIASIMEKAACEKVFDLKYVKRLIASKEETIDLIIVEKYHTQCFHLLAHKLNASVVLLSPFTPILGIEYVIGNPYNPAVTPMATTKLTYKMDFWQRLMNTLQYPVLIWYHNYKFNEYMDEYAREVFNMELPSSEELNRRTALAFYNNHFSFISRPQVPNLVNIAGIHIKEPKALPKDIEDFIAGSSHGVILFSFGSTIKASSIPAEMLKMIADVFSSIPQKILWRVDQLNITKVPPNVKLGKWFPQRDILEHNNVIAFISHGGAMGLFEAMHTGTPVIAVPLFGDQYHNTNILVEKNAAIYVDYATMDRNTLTAAIEEIKTNKKYRENMQALSKTFKDRPLSPLDEALYWTEYVLKHQGAPHLRTAGADMPFYQYLLLDVIVFLLGIVLVFVYLLRSIFKMIISFTCQQQKRTKTKIKTK